MLSNVVEISSPIRKSRGGKAKAPPITKKNGHHPVVLLAGGPADLAREIRERLANRMGLNAKYHLDYEKPATWQRPIPSDVDLVIFLKDMAGHREYDLIKGRAKRQRVRLMSTSKKWSTMTSALHGAGLRAASLPESVKSVQILEEPPKPFDLVEMPVVDTSPEIVPKAHVQMEIEVPPINIHVAPHTSAAATEMRRGSPRAETAVLIGMLYRLATEDGIQILITPTSFSVEPAPVPH